VGGQSQQQPSPPPPPDQKNAQTRSHRRSQPLECQEKGSIPVFGKVIQPGSAAAGKHLPLALRLGVLSSSGSHKLKGTTMPAM